MHASEGAAPVDGAPGTALDPLVATRLKRDADGLVCAVVQQHDTREVLMVGWMDDEALRRALTGGRATFWRRSRQGDGRRAVLEPVAARVLAPGRAVGASAVGARRRPRLRRRRPARRGRPGRRGLP